MSQANGKVKQLLGTKTADYRPPAFIMSALGTNLGWGGFTLMQVDEMLEDDHVCLCLDYRTSPLHQAKFKLTCADPDLRSFLIRTLKRYWRKSLQTALTCFPWGWAGSEVLYRWNRQRHCLEFDALRHLHALDVRPMVLDGRLAQVKVLPSRGGVNLPVQGPSEEIALLPAATESTPAKGFWCVHGSVFNQFYGRSCLKAPWWWWRCKTLPDGLREIFFKWCYKHAYSGMVIYAPDQVYQDTPGGPEVHARDYARQMGEQAKTGANFTLDGAMDENGNRLWAIEQYGKIEGDAKGLIDSLEFANKGIQRGIGIPDEVVTYDGSKGSNARAQVSVSAFFVRCQVDLHYHLESADDQIFRPLARLNHGHAEYGVEAEPLLPPDTEEGGKPQPQPGKGPQGQAGAGAAPPVQLSRHRDRDCVLVCPATGEVTEYGREPRRGTSVYLSLAGDLHRAGRRVDRDPSDRQKKAGNYRKGHLRLQGLPVTVEIPRGGTRSGTSPDGTTWRRRLHCHYGYVKGTKGKDGDHVDVFVGPDPDSQVVFVVDQVDAAGKFDEHKCLLGFSNEADAVRAYLRHYPRGWKVGPVTALTMSDFRAWLKDGNKRRMASELSRLRRPVEMAVRHAPKGGITVAGKHFAGGRFIPAEYLASDPKAARKLEAIPDEQANRPYRKLDDKGETRFVGFASHDEGGKDREHWVGDGSKYLSAVADAWTDKLHETAEDVAQGLRELAEEAAGREDASPPEYVAEAGREAREELHGYVDQLRDHLARAVRYQYGDDAKLAGPDKLDEVTAEVKTQIGEALDDMVVAVEDLRAAEDAGDEDAWAAFDDAAERLLRAAAFDSIGLEDAATEWTGALDDAQQERDEKWEAEAQNFADQLNDGDVYEDANGENALADAAFNNGVLAKNGNPYRVVHDDDEGWVYANEEDVDDYPGKEKPKDRKTDPKNPAQGLLFSRPDQKRDAAGRWTQEMHAARQALAAGPRSARQVAKAAGMNEDHAAAALGALHEGGHVEVANTIRGRPYYRAKGGKPVEAPTRPVAHLPEAPRPKDWAPPSPAPEADVAHLRRTLAGLDEAHEGYTHLAVLRRSLGWHPDRADAALHALRQAGHASLRLTDGRFGTSDEDRAAGFTDEGGGHYGFVTYHGPRDLSRWDADQHPKDEAGRWARKGGKASRAMRRRKERAEAKAARKDDPLLQLAALPGHAEHALVEGVQRNVARLPPALRRPLVAAWDVVTASYQAGDAAVKRVAEATGDDAVKAACLVGWASAVWAKTPALLNALGADVPEELAWVPVPALAYLLFSTARKPLTTLREAAALVAETAAAVARGVGLSLLDLQGGDGDADVARLVAWLGEATDRDLALFCTALGHTHTLGAALDLADRADSGYNPARPETAYERFRRELEGDAGG